MATVKAKKAPNLVLIPSARLVTFQGVAVKVKYDNKTKKTVPAEDGKYGLTLLIPLTDNIDYIKQAMQTAIAAEDSREPIAKWEKCIKNGDRIIERNVKKNPDKSPDRWSMYKGMWVLEAKSNLPPRFSIPEGGKTKDLEDVNLINNVFYSGCMVAAELNIVANKIDTGKLDEHDEPVFNYYINAYHNGVLKIGDGERFGRRSSQDVFKSVIGGKTAANPTTGDEDF